MAPWISTILFSPVAVGVLIVVVFLSLLMLRAVGARTFQAIGWRRLLGGYIVASIALIPLGLMLGEFSLESSFEVWLGLSFVGWLILATLIVPSIFILISQKRGSVMMAIIMGASGALPIQGLLFLLSGPMGREALTGLRFFNDTVRLAIFLSVVALGFSLGARLPWTIRKVLSS